MSPCRIPFVPPGLHLLSQKFRPAGRVKSAPGGRVLALTEPFERGAFIDADGDGSLSAYISDCGPADEIISPSSVRYEPK